MDTLSLESDNHYFLYRKLMRSLSCPSLWRSDQQDAFFYCGLCEREESKVSADARRQFPSNVLHRYDMIAKFCVVLQPAGSLSGELLRSLY